MHNADKNGEWHLRTQLPVDFEIKYVNGVLDPKNKEIMNYGNQGKHVKRIVIVDRKISQYYLKEIVKYFVENSVQYHLITIQATEENKNIDTLLFILREIEKIGLNRQSEPIIAIGGGVLLDIVGLAASLYRRGVPYIKIPTTLLGIVDASVGVKTAINFEDRRNRIGTYHPPVAAYLDTNFLRTIDSIEISSGLGEILKMAVVKDVHLYNLLRDNGRNLLENKFIDCASSEEVISLAVKGMKDELQENLWEKNLERYVDFGHSFSPIPEMRSLVDNTEEALTHGQAVTLDVIYSCVISNLRGHLSSTDVLSVIKTARAMGLPTTHNYFQDPNILLEALNDTVRHRNGDQNLPIPISIGHSIFINDLTFQNIKDAAIRMKEFNDEFE
jgi:2-epi-5-epi-valiolone synthase